MDSDMKTKRDDDSDLTAECVRSVIDRFRLLKRSLDALCECFLVRADDNDPDPLWRRFYSIQMCQYLIAKRNLMVSEPEGDMVHDLIRDSWDEVKDYMENSMFGPISNVDQWFKTIKVDFPLDPFDPDCLFCNQKVLLLCQKDTKKGCREETV